MERTNTSVQIIYGEKYFLRTGFAFFQNNKNKL